VTSPADEIQPAKCVLRVKKSRAPVNSGGGQFLTTDDPTVWLTPRATFGVRGVFLSDPEKDPKPPPRNTIVGPPDVANP